MKKRIKVKKLTVFFYTLGCKVNQYESQAMGEILQNEGFSVVLNPKDADIIVVNSCTVTGESSRKTRQTIRRLKKNNPKAIMMLTGCMVQAFPEAAVEIGEADIVIGNTDYDKVAEVIDEYFENRNRIVAIKEHKTGEKYTELSVSGFSEHTRSYMKKEDGCNRFCSYCIIPYARGRVRSRSVEDIKKEALRLSQNGFKEIVLVGINLSAFGQDTGAELCDAVEAVAAVDGIERVRLGSLECDMISDNALDRLANCSKFCPQFHLSLQSGCDKTLKEMNRKYDKEFYRDLVKRIRARFENPSITTDVMVGFSGETEQDFEESRKFVEEIGFARSHIFIYSVREGTKAAERTDRVDLKVKQERSQRMQATAICSEKAFLHSQVGRISKVLFEEMVDGAWEGYTENYTRVRVNSDCSLEGKILPVLITAAGDGLCDGELPF